MNNALVTLPKDVEHVSRCKMKRHFNQNKLEKQQQQQQQQQQPNVCKSYKPHA